MILIIRRSIFAPNGDPTAVKCIVVESVERVKINPEAAFPPPAESNCPAFPRRLSFRIDGPRFGGVGGLQIILPQG